MEYHSKAEQFWNEQAAWSRATFGSDHERGPLGPLKHLEKEAKEAQDSIFGIISVPPRDTQEHLEEEIVDCLFLTFDAARRAGMSFDELFEVAFRKLEVNKNRKWQTSKPGEAVEHVRDNES